MTVVAHISFQGMQPSQALSAEISRMAQDLSRFAPRLQACDVTVRRLESSHVHGNHYCVHARAILPGAKVEAGMAKDDDPRCLDAYLAARDTFDALRRQIQDLVRIRRGDIKAHVPARNEPEPS